MKEDAFDSWWNGLEGFHLLSERAYAELCDEYVPPELLQKWMKACWNAALEAAEDYNAVDVSKLKAKFS